MCDSAHRNCRFAALVIRLLAPVLLTVAGTALAADVEALRVWASPERTRAVFDVSGPLDYKLFQLEHPNRIVLDISASRFAKAFTAPDKAGGLLMNVRSGKHKDGVRVVFDLDEDVRPKSFLLKPADKLGYRLVVDLYPKSGSASVRTVAEALPGIGRNVVVALDPGHGGEDPGAIGPTKSREKVITLAVARALKERIDREPGMSAILTRDGDYFIPLKERYRKAREGKADVFVSIHADAFTSSDARGSSVWVLSPRGATSEAARWLADRENRADLVGGVSLDDKDDTLAAVLLDLSQGATMSASNGLARDVLAALRTLGKTHRGYVERANFVVLRSPDVPSILVETGFITNPAEERRLKDPRHRDEIAGAVLKGIRNYVTNTPPPGTWYAIAAADNISVSDVQARASRKRAPAMTLAKAADTPGGTLRDLHRVARGETLSGIAHQYGVSLNTLRSANHLDTSGLLRTGDVLQIPSI